MQVFEVTAQYHLVRLGDDEALNKSEKIAEYMAGAFDDSPLTEAVWVIALNQKMRPLGRTKISSGNLTSSIVHPREVFRFLVMVSAARFALAHNHPSGNPEPSRPDMAVTKQMLEAGKIMGIDLVDHIVIGRCEDDPKHRGFFSFADAGLIGGAA